MKLLTKEQTAKLQDNARRQAPVKGTPAEIDFEPIVRLFNAYGTGTWLLTELDPDGDTAMGLCDLGMGSPEFGSVSLTELAGLRHPIGMSIVERDIHWTPRGPISAYIDAANTAGEIVEPEHAGTPT